MTVEYWPIDSVKPYPGNPRKIPASAVAKVADSIRTFGWKQPLVVDVDGTIVVGHTRLQGAQKLKLERVPVVVATDLTPEQIRAYRLADNRTNQEAEWDIGMLAVEMGDLAAMAVDLSSTAFDEDEIEKLLAKPSAGLTDEDAVPEVQAEVVTKPGDLWLLGKHRLLCGDSTSIDAVERLMGGGLADMVFTDPPYGVNYTGGAKKREALANDHNGTAIYAEALPMLQVAAADHAALYLWYADAHAAAAAAAAAGYVITAQVIWVKNNAQFVSSAHYHGKHEPCFYAHRKGKSAAWYGENNEVTVWEVDRANKNEFHPTQKPVALARRAIENSSKGGDAILDLFGGSGSTLIACEETARAARLMELEPKYCDVIVRRWQEFTGKQATLDGDGRTFDEIAAGVVA